MKAGHLGTPRLACAHGPGVPRALIPAVLWGAAIAQAAFGLTLAALNRRDLERLFAEYVLSQVAATLAFATVGALIMSRRPENRVGRLFGIIGIVAGLTTWVGQYARYALVTAPGALPGGDLAAWIYMWGLAPFLALTVVATPLVFPDGRLPSQRWRPLVGVAALATALLAVHLAVAPGPVDASLPEVSNPFSPAPAAMVLHGLSRGLTPVIFGFWIISLLGAIAAPVARFRRGDRAERRQIKWFAYATALLVAAVAVPIAAHWPDFTSTTLLSGILLTLALPALPIAAGVAILRDGLYDIDLVINRTLVYGGLTVCVVGVYISVVVALGAIVRTEDNVLVSLIVAAVIAVAFQPLRGALQRRVDRLVYGERGDPYAVISRLGRRLDATLAPAAVLPTIVETVAEALRLPYVAVAVPEGDAKVIAAAHGAAAGSPISLPLIYHQEAVGDLIVAPRRGEAGFADADRRLLEDLARQAGIAVHTARLTTEVQRSRERLVTAREEERRRLRRDLHDGLGPTLAGFTLTLGAIRNLLPRDPTAADALLADLEVGIEEAVAEIRRLVYGLRPPALDEHGLAGAIRARAASYGVGPGALRVRVEAPDRLPALPAAVEVAAYRIAEEALTNVVRHAAARSCLIRLVVSDALCLDVIDDGIGLPVAVTFGVGLISLRERAAELGGECRVEANSGGGTLVRARLPLPEG